jgi:hypothetical protein
MKGVEPAAAGFGIGMLGPVGIIGVPTGAGSGVGMCIWGVCGTTGGTYTGVAVPTIGGCAGCGSDMCTAGAMNGCARMRAAADNEGTANR